METIKILLNQGVITDADIMEFTNRIIKKKVKKVRSYDPAVNEKINALEKKIKTLEKKREVLDMADQLRAASLNKIQPRCSPVDNL